MAEKKRKASNPLPASKKNKSSAPLESLKDSTAAENDVVVKAKTNRKRAADFLDGDEDGGVGILNTDVAVSEKPAKKSKKSTAANAKSQSSSKTRQHNEGVSLTADGVNGVVEHSDDSDVEITTGDVPPETSLMAEGARTADKELADSSEDEGGENEADHGAALLAGFDSDSEDPAEDKNLDLSKVAPIPNHKSTIKKLRDAAQKGSDGPGAVYVGRIPHGFYEKQMREYFSQFGDISKLRLSRNKRTSASKHFAFIEFASDEVAKIVAEAMDNYLMFGHILKCKYAPAENLHPDVWKGANKKFRKIPHDKLERQKLEAPKTTAEWNKKNRKENQKRRKNAAKLQELGYDLPLPTLQDPSTALKDRQIGTAPTADANVLNGEVAENDEAADVAKEPLQNESKRGKKTKQNTKAANPLTEGNLGAQDAGHYITAPKSAEKSVKPIKNSTSAVASKALTQDTTDSTGKATDGKKKPKKSNPTKGSSSMSTDKGEYDNLSSIPIGVDASGYTKQDDTTSSSNILTIAGVADAVLKERKKGRKKPSKSQTDKEIEDEAAADVNEIAPFASRGVKAGKKTKVKGSKE